MDSEVDIAICLRQWDYSETSQTAALLCKRLGVVRVLGKGTKRADPRFSGGLEIATIGEAVIVPKSNSGLSTLAGWDLRSTCRGARADLQCYYAAMFTLEVAINLLPEGEPHPDSFLALESLLESISSASWQRDIATYLWRILKDSGFAPRIDRGLSGPVVFLPAIGQLTSPKQEHRLETAWEVLGTTASALEELAESGDSSHLTPEDAERVGRLLAWYVREVIERDLSTLRPLFGNLHPRTTRSLL
ncbi:MAG: DNA repair protein RecO [Phycisphaera sp.]|nr:MAG: DNA repair protein RecO [Phycisphaera sp.]